MYFLFFVLLLFSLGAATAEQRCDDSEFALSAPTDRFDDNGDGTVTDSASGLMWMRCSLGQSWQGGNCVGELASVDWIEAQRAAKETNSSGSYFFSDWRVPKLPELAMIIERQCHNPRINLAIFPNTAAEKYWTSTTRPGDESNDDRYALSFGPDGVRPVEKDERNHVRLVRTAK
jgi:hypothetical protein